MRSNCSLGTEVLVWGDEKVLEFDSGDWLHNNVNVVNATKLYVQNG